jgi:DNA-binding transcriptional ArsR family regulator
VSVKASTWAWHEVPQSVHGNDLLVLLALADVADDDGECVYVKAADATEEALGSKAHMSSRTFRRSLRALEERGLVVVERESTHTANKYRLNLTGQLVRSGEDTLSGQTGQLVRSDRTTVSSHKTYLRKEEALPLLPREEVEQKPPRKKPETALPVWWRPTPVHAEKARALGLDLHAEEESFRLHAEAHDRRAASWNAAFTMWLSKAAGFRGAGVAPAVPKPVRTSLTAEQVIWLRDRRVSVEEYEERKNEPGWLESLTKMEAVNA